MATSFPRSHLSHRCGRAAAEVGDGLLQHRLVELDADFLDVAGLLLAQQIAEAADIHVVAGHREAGAEAVELLHHLQPPLGVAGDELVVRQGEIGVGARLAAADAAAQLVKLRQAEQLRAVDEDGVRPSGCRVRIR
ncbi:MAG: hypothetical protein WDN72_06195 [Alphaproteobacteria bacterium]